MFGPFVAGKAAWLGWAQKQLVAPTVSPKSDEGGSETQAEAQHHGKGRACRENGCGKECASCYLP